jgi:amino acid permease
MCLAMGIAGFLSFGSKTQGNVLNNFPSDNVVVNIARLYTPHIVLDTGSFADFDKLFRSEHADHSTT